VPSFEISIASATLDRNSVFPVQCWHFYSSRCAVAIEVLVVMTFS